jgi:hypothetical protein
MPRTPRNQDTRDAIKTTAFRPRATAIGLGLIAVTATGCASGTPSAHVNAPATVVASVGATKPPEAKRHYTPAEGDAIIAASWACVAKHGVKNVGTMPHILPNGAMTVTIAQVRAFNQLPLTVVQACNTELRAVANVYDNSLRAKPLPEASTH